MPIKTPLLYLFLICSTIQVYSQDQLIFPNKPAKFVDKITTITKDSLTYINFKKTKTIYLKKLSGYYITIDTKENLEKRFYKRNRTYFPVKLTPKKLGKKDPNLYLAKEAKNNLPSLNLKKFKEGYFIQKNDTIFCKIYAHKKNSSAPFLYIITLKNDNSKRVYKASEIDYYYINGTLFKSFDFENKTIKTSFFLKQIEKGAFYLYERNSIPSHQTSEYYLKQKGDDFFYIMSLEETPIKSDGNLNTVFHIAENTKVWLSISSSKEEFKSAINNLFGACASIKNKVSSEFYTQSDLALIVREFNKCNIQ